MSICNRVHTKILGIGITSVKRLLFIMNIDNIITNIVDAFTRVMPINHQQLQVPSTLNSFPFWDDL